MPVAQVNLVVLSGTADDPPGKYGVASLTAAMLEEGAGSRSALEIADAVDFLGADLGAASGIDSSAVRLHVPVARLADALPIMADVALRPTFPKDELERLRQQRLTSLLQARDDPPTISSRSRSRASSTARRTATARRRWAPPRRSRRSPPTTCAAFYAGGVPAGQRDAARGRRRHAPTRCCRCSRRASARGRRPAPAAAEKLPAGRAAAGAADLSRRQAGRAAVADPHRLRSACRARRPTTSRSR